VLVAYLTITRKDVQNEPAGPPVRS
jgi:hypothetical protein